MALAEQQRKGPTARDIAEALIAAQGRRGTPQATPADATLFASLSKLAERGTFDRRGRYRVGASGPLADIHRALERLGVDGGVDAFLGRVREQRGDTVDPVKRRLFTNSVDLLSAAISGSGTDGTKPRDTGTGSKLGRRRVKRRSILYGIRGGLIAAATGGSIWAGSQHGDSQPTATSGASDNGPEGGQSTQGTNPELKLSFDGLTKEQTAQINAIAAVDLGNDVVKNRNFIMGAVAAAMRGKDYAAKKHVRIDVMVAQMIHETGFGKSEKAWRYNNFLGMQAKKGDPTWAGIGSVTIDGRDWRAFTDIDQCVRNYTDTLSSDAKAQYYGDAIANYSDLPTYVRNMNEYSNDSPTYPGEILDIINRYHLSELLGYQTQPAPQETKSTGVVSGEGIRLNPDAHRANHQATWTVGDLSPNWTVTDTKGRVVHINNEQELPWDERYRIVEQNFHGIRLTVDKYREFLQVMADPNRQRDLSNQTVSLPHFNNPKMLQPSDIKYLVAHYTNTSATGLTGWQAAVSMSGTSAGVSSHGYIDTYGDDWDLTFRKTGNVPGFNNVTRGWEVEAKSMETVNTKQLESLIMAFTRRMELDKYISKDPNAKGFHVGAVVDAMIRGHGSFYGQKGDGNYIGDHTDFVEIVMDPIRQLLKDFLVLNGYTL